jgi:hypothetical protein
MQYRNRREKTMTDDTAGELPDVRELMTPFAG